MISDSNSQQTRATSLGGVNGSDDFVLDLPVAHYKPLRIGTVGRKTKLEEILDKVNLSFEDYIWYTDVSKVIFIQ